MTTLATRIEAAQPGQERELLWELYCTIHPQPAENEKGWLSWTMASAPFQKLSRAEAWLSAVEMLVPEGLAWTCGKNVHHGYWHASFNKLNEDGEPISVGCSNATATPALALAAAIARSLGHE